MTHTFTVMGILQAFKPTQKTEQRSYNPTWLQQFNEAFFAANQAGSNQSSMNEQTALTISAVYSANKLLSEIPASLEVQVRERNGEYFGLLTKGRVAKVLRKPNAYQTSYQYFQSMFMRMNIRGNSYAFIKRDEFGGKEMYPILDSVTISVSPKGDEIFYGVGGQWFSAYEIIHFRGMSLDGIVGLSPIHYAARTLMNAVDAEKYMSKVYENGIITTGFFTTAEKLTEKTYSRLQKDIKSKSGIDRAGEARILEQGLKFERNTLSAVDTEIIEQMSFSVEEVCRIYRIPKHLLYLDSKGGSTKSFSTQAKEFLTYSLSPSLSNVEEELESKLLTLRDYESGNFRIKFATKSLLRASPEERAKYYKELFNIGSMTPNEIRAEEGMPPIEGGDTSFVQLNLAPIDQLEEIIQDKINKQIDSTN